jgi:hypothetical protein
MMQGRRTVAIGGNHHVTDDPRDQTEAKIVWLALKFPCLRNAPGAEPWGANRLDDWAAGGGPSHGEKCAARFILAVWDPNHEWQSGRFDLMEALGIWDSASHQAFLDWAANPWWA